MAVRPRSTSAAALADAAAAIHELESVLQEQQQSMQTLRLHASSAVYELQLKENFTRKHAKKLEAQLLAKQEDGEYAFQPLRARIAELRKERAAPDKSIEQRRADGWIAMLNVVSSLEPIDAESGLARVDALWEASESTAAEDAALAEADQRESQELQRLKKEAVEELDRLKRAQGSAESRAAKDLEALRSAVEAKSEEASRLREQKTLLEEKVASMEREALATRTAAAAVPSAKAQAAAESAQPEPQASGDAGESGLR